MSKGKVDVNAGLFPRVCLLLGSEARVVELEALDLGPDYGSIAQVEGEQAVRNAVASRLSVSLDEVPGKVGTTEMFEVHRQECHFRCHVTVAKAIVELDAIEDLDWISQADATGVKIAVAVANVVASNAFGEDASILTQKRLSGRADLS